MSGVMFAMEPCFGCRNLFTFNPHKVPSITYQGTRRPICQACVTRVNPMREANGLDLIVVLPGAYEATEEL